MAEAKPSEAPYVPPEPVQWCELHEGQCDDVEPLRRVTYGSLGQRVVIILACHKCLRALYRAGYTRWGRWSGIPCLEVVAPVLTGEGRKPYVVELLPLQVIYLRALGVEVRRYDGQLHETTT